jgi:hypothetical protein
MMYTIRQIIEKVLNGQIRIPTFQRGFVWEPEMVAFLMDSIYKGYPFGTLLFWRTKTQLKTEKKIGPFDLIDKEAGIPFDYVLDGQQRITSIFGVFQTDLTPLNDDTAFQIYFDYSAQHDAQESQFLSLSQNEVDTTKHFPLNCLFDSVKYRAATTGLDAANVTKIDELQTKFKEALIPIQMLETEDKAKVAIVFERINRKGVELDIFQLLNAWTWSESFELQKNFEELQDELEPFGFRAAGEDVDLVLRCAAGIISGNAAAKSLIELNGNEVRTRFDEITNGLKGAIDFLKSNLKVEKLINLPYNTLLIPLSAFFAVPGNKQFNYNDEQRQNLVKWFWRSCFSKRFSAGVLRNLNTDIAESLKLRNLQNNTLANFKTEVSKEFYKEDQFKINTVNTKTFVLQLAQNEPRSFISGSPITLRDVLQDYNRNQFHHIFPRAYLKTIVRDENDVNSLANFCFLSKSDNNKLGGDKPSTYKTKMAKNTDDILSSAFTSNIIFLDNFENFLDDRASKLWENASSLIRIDG